MASVFLVCALAVFFFPQFVLSRPDATEEGSLKSVEAKVSVAVDDLRKAVGDMFKNLTDVIQSEIAKNPEASALFKNVTESLSSAAQQVKDAVSSVTPKP
ncbi:uncharacterized protein LOC117642983 [Thrips palmi]|uniref:Uncharacterized protein LOC117642983 n=1 Tax=Thrips palmi TaxID=161013 RepID=A0A6P8YL55_THRPL|nr:uncharacterized protein LOC117642983 [Thrips palmi]